jgi:hypothetical protein
VCRQAQWKRAELAEKLFWRIKFAFVTKQTPRVESSSSRDQQKQRALVRGTKKTKSAQSRGRLQNGAAKAFVDMRMDGNKLTNLLVGRGVSAPRHRRLGGRPQAGWRRAELLAQSASVSHPEASLPVAAAGISAQRRAGQLTVRR